MTGNRATFWAIWALGMLPVLLAVAVYTTGVGIPSEQVNTGRLLQPAVPLKQWGGQADRFTRHWSLLLVHRDGCDQTCLQQEERLKRIHDALGRDADRFRVRMKVSGVLAPGVWVVDPLGNLILHYGQAYEGKAVLTDLRRLLKASRLG